MRFPYGGTMNYLRLPGLDDAVSVFAVCQAHAQLESDYNNGGWLRERPSNRRRMGSTGCQLQRMRYSSPYQWVNICNPCEREDPDDDAVRGIYLRNVLNWGLPIDAEMMTFIKARYVPEFIARYPQCAGVDYLQGGTI
jgi:hypothetical protein